MQSLFPSFTTVARRLTVQHIWCMSCRKIVNYWLAKHWLAFRKCVIDVAIIFLSRFTQFKCFLFRFSKIEFTAFHHRCRHSISSIYKIAFVWIFAFFAAAQPFFIATKLAPTCVSPSQTTRYGFILLFAGSRIKTKTVCDIYIKLPCFPFS